MLTVQDLMNPNLKDKESEITFKATLGLRDINLQDFNNVIHEYVNVVDDKEQIIGAVKAERLAYLVAKHKEDSFIQILNTMDSGLVAIDNDSRIFYVNPAYGRILQINVSKIIGRYLNIIEPDADLLKVLKTKESQHTDNKHIKSVNTYVNASMYPVFEGKKISGAYSIFTDVTTVNKLHKEVKRMSAVAEEYSQQIKDKNFLEDNHIIGESKGYIESINKAMKVAKTDTMVLLRGENGTGKEIVASIIKDHGTRQGKPFITVNCSAIPETLIESEPFGYEEGAFTGASKGGKMGKFQLADGGTLFLDEIGDMPQHMQAKLLRVLQEGEIEKVGRQSNIPIDVRVIAATNKPLEEMVKEGKFREDLYYRLNVVSISIPPLRERGNDVFLLTNHFLKRYCEKYKRQLRIDRAVYQIFLAYKWPGNVRELQNTIESAVVLCEGTSISPKDLPDNIRGNTVKTLDMPAIRQDSRQLGTLKEEMQNFEKQVILQVIEQCKGDKSKAMEALDVPKRTFYRKIANFGTKDE